LSQTILFTDRFSAGEQLAQLVSQEISQGSNRAISPIVYALPRGAIPVAIPVARKLKCPLDIIVAKKITTFSNRELAIGAVTTDGNVLWSSPKLLKRISCDLLNESRSLALEKALTQESQFASYRPQVNAEGDPAIIIDDGIATGMTILAAAEAIKANHQTAQVWIASPVAPRSLLPELNQSCNRLFILETPSPFLSVSRFYLHFDQVTTSSALDYLQQYNQQFSAAPKSNV